MRARRRFGSILRCGGTRAAGLRAVVLHRGSQQHRQGDDGGCAHHTKHGNHGGSRIFLLFRRLAVARRRGAGLPAVGVILRLLRRGVGRLLSVGGLPVGGRLSVRSITALLRPPGRGLLPALPAAPGRRLRRLHRIRCSGCAVGSGGVRRIGCGYRGAFRIAGRRLFRLIRGVGSRGDVFVLVGNIVEPVRHKSHTPFRLVVFLVLFASMISVYRENVTVY